MTSTSPNAPLCERCGLRPVSESSGPSLNPELQNLCDDCLSARMEQAIRDMGGQLEAAMRESGEAVPGGMSGEEFVRSMLEDMRQREESPEWQEYLTPMRQAMKRITAELQAELPGGFENPAFAAEMERRMERWHAEHPELKPPQMRDDE